jgi:D-alanyl-lipoteichoic acid acyltransferase DltB (MBOAT superfamily)
MIFSSINFMVFFVVVLGLYSLARNYPQRAAVILAASILFYASWKPAYLILLTASLTINYGIYSILFHRRSKAWLVTGVCINIAVLVFYKYLGLFVETAFGLGRLLGIDTPDTRPTWIDWALPLGISFYTFHMLSVMIDVYRGEWTKHISFLSWTLYVTFFPHMIAGPILRASELVEQLEQLRGLNLNNLRTGMLIFIAGLAKKVLFADNLAPIVGDLYSQPAQLDFWMAWFATIAFALQIYFDFSGYSEMAIGLAKMFGVTLPRNFKYPYISRSVREFWQRWHITLSRWLRDYLYISLGGSRRGHTRNLLNLMTTMLLGGLWHGAGWTFVFWGFLHGSYLVLHRLLLDLYARLGWLGHSLSARLISWAGLPTTFILVCFTWVFFRATNFTDAWTISGAMLGLADPVGAAPQVRGYLKVLAGIAFVVAYIEPWLVRVVSAHGLLAWWRVPYPVRGLAYAGLVLLLTIFGGGTQKFIYFDF